MLDLEQWETKDPERVAIRREAQSCRGCQSIETVRLFGTVETICDDGRPKERRCRKYKEAK
jgi:hypothetical protein